MKRLLVALSLLIILIVSVFSTTHIDSTAFDISAFKDGVPPRTTVRITTGVSNLYEYDYASGISDDDPVFDITAAAAVGSSTVANAIIVEVSTNERSTVSITLTFTPFKKYNEGRVLVDDRSQWVSSKYLSSNPTVENGGVGVVENCIVKGKTYTYYSKLTTKASFDTEDSINRPVANNSDGESITITNIVIAKDSSGTTVGIPSGFAQSLPGIRNNMLTSKRVFDLSNVVVSGKKDLPFEVGKEYISYVSVYISVD